MAVGRERTVFSLSSLHRRSGTDGSALGRDIFVTAFGTNSSDEFGFMRGTTWRAVLFFYAFGSNADHSGRSTTMTKQLLAGAAALALLSGAAAAQSTFESTRTTTVSPAVPAPTESYSSTKTERTVTPGGAAVETQQSYKSDASGTASTTERQVVRPDGSSATTTRKEWTNAPAPTASTTTTTTIQR